MSTRSPAAIVLILIAVARASAIPPGGEGRIARSRGRYARSVAATALQRSSILEDPARPQAERQRDAGSRPLDVYEWLGIRQGMVVADLLPYAGYNSHLLARLVGEQGRVLAIGANPSSRAALEQRFASAGIDNVEIHDDPSSVPTGSIDVLITIRNVHDMYIPEMVQRYGISRDALFAEIRRVLKPAGTLGVVDARTTRAGVDPGTHRINEESVIQDLEAAGFELVDSSSLLAVPGDDHSVGGDPRWLIDRFLLKFRKPQVP